MSIIQKIREKAAWLVFGLIALSLIGFLLMDAFVGKRGVLGNKSTTLGVVNGENIEYQDFEMKVAAQEEQYRAQGYQTNEGIQQNIREQIWKQQVEDAVLGDLYGPLGLTVSDKEINDMLVGADAIPDIKRAFTDPKTGIFDAQQAANQINQLRALYKSGKKTDQRFEAAKRFFEESIPQLINMRLKEKYLSLLGNSAYVPKWMIEKQNADNSQVSSISYVNTPYITIPDSAVKVSESEISDYVDKHKEQFKQTESRSIAYVSFNAGPTSADSNRVRQQLLDLKTEFSTATDPQAFLGRVGTENPYADTYFGKSKIQVPYKDSILVLPKGGLFGPYLDGGSYSIAKVIDEKVLPDSVRARHILIATVNPQDGKVILEDSVAKKRIDSIRTLIVKGLPFDSAVARFSDDQGSKEKGGDLGYFTPGRMVKAFNDFCFNGKTGDKGIVKSEFGYHYIEVTDQKEFEPAFKIAYLARKIDASQETDQAASGLASQFAGESRDQKAFDANVQKDNLAKLLAPEIQPTDYAVPGLGANRQLVRWIYDAKLGEVSEPFSVGDKYVVAIVTEINEEGIASAAKARPRVEPILRNRKKAELITAKIGNAASLEAVAAATAQQIQHADSILFAAPYIPNVGQEAKVIGASFDKSLQGKPESAPIAGNGGVFVIKVENVSAKPNPSIDVEQQRFSQEQQQKSRIYQVAVELLTKNASIKDNRGKFF
ncbi:MAG: SurA N-terminal domain-containing protein [Puia sp.]|nr:SurA N-terminal domain-containing protein [Puia sp.]